MPNSLKVKLITPNDIVYDETALSVTIPAEEGEIQVFQGHIPVLARIKKGDITIENSGKEPVVFGVAEGFFRVTSGGVDLLVDSIKKPE